MGETFPIAFGRYELTERLAVGGMAELFKANVSGAHGFTKQVVIKRILPHLAVDEHFNTMFIDEAKITARLSHPKIAQTLELGKFGGQLYIAMEYVDGLDVLAMLRECAHRRTRVPIRLAVHIITEILDALDFAHNQTDSDGKELRIVHRDISPSNVLVSRRGDVKLVDFGIAQASERQQETKSGTLKGKYGYMAPEQVVGRPLDARSDLFSSAIVMVEMAMGRRLFVSPNELDVLLMVRDVKLERLGKYGQDIAPDLDVILRKALAKEPDDRYQSCAEFRDVLSEWQFENRHRVTARDCAVLVNELYDSAWARKRKQKTPELERQLVAAEDAVARQAEGGATDPAVPPVEAEGPGGREFPTSASMEEAIALVAGELDGIPVGEQRGMESAPVVLIEKTDPEAEIQEEVVAAAPTGPDEIIEIEGLDINLEDDLDDLQIDEVSLDEDYDLGELAEELRASPERSEESVSREMLEITTQEIAFDDIVAAVENALPRELSDKTPRMPSEEEKQEARRRLPTLSEVQTEPDDAGDLSELAPLRVLSRLAVARATGLLVVTVGGIKKEIYIVDGRPEFVSSNLASELFGEYLVGQKVISEGELSMALAMMPHYSGKLGDTLVGLGLMKPLDVFRHLTQQVRDKLIDVCTWSKGSFEWYDSVLNEREAFPLDLDPFEVLGAGAMAVQIEHVNQWIGSVKHLAFRSATSSDLSPESFQLGQDLRDVYNQLDGRRSVGDLVDRFTDQTERSKFARMLYLIAMTELAQPVE